MKYKPGDKLYYVSPFIFNIEIIHVAFEDLEGKEIYYVDTDGGYLSEKDLFDNFEEAQDAALNRLELYYQKRKLEIQEDEIN